MCFHSQLKSLNQVVAYVHLLPDNANRTSTQFLLNKLLQLFVLGNLKGSHRLLATHQLV